jgi:histidyl-tRNA synthetase
MAKISNISGFPEYLPEERIIEEQLLSTIGSIFRLHGFASMETPSVELVSTLTEKGGDEKEIYTLARFQAESDGPVGKEAELGLHFDLTVPFARYVAQHLARLTFPFRRSCYQKSWRGERPQKGRYREFGQFDIDIVARDTLPVAADGEIITVIAKVFARLEILRSEMRLNNRKILLGMYDSLGIGGEKRAKVVRIVDKLHKIGPEGVTKELVDGEGIEGNVAERILQWATLRSSASEARSMLTGLGVENETFQRGVEELLEVISLVPENLRSLLCVDLSLARGLDYYTGTIFEVVLPDYPAFGSVSAGGRYDDLTAQFLPGQRLPAVGGSIGVTRLMGLILEQRLYPVGPQCPSQVLFTVYSEESRQRTNEWAEQFRERGIASEVYFKGAKLGKQIEYANSKGIRFCAFVDEEAGTLEIKDLGAQQQTPVLDIDSWIAQNRGVLRLVKN